MSERIDMKWFKSYANISVMTRITDSLLIDKNFISFSYKSFLSDLWLKQSND